MALPYRARLNEQTFLNLPGIHGGAYIFTYVEDTSDCGLRQVASPFVVFERDEVSSVAGSLLLLEASVAATAGAKRPM